MVIYFLNVVEEDTPVFAYVLQATRIVGAACKGGAAYEIIGLYVVGFSLMYFILRDSTFGIGQPDGRH